MKRNRIRGFTLIEMLLVIAILAALASLAFAGARRYLAASKQSEAKLMMSGIGRAIAELHDRDEAASQLLAPGTLSGASGSFFCAACGAEKVCVSQNEVPHGTKYMPDNTGGRDFDACCWRCIRFTIDSPIYYQYRYSVGESYVGPALGGPDPGPKGVEIAAIGDLDGDLAEATFTLVGHVDPASGDLRLATQIFASNAEE